MEFEDEVRTVRPWPAEEDSDVADRIAIVRNRGIIHGGETTRRHFVALGRTPKDGTRATGKDLRGSGTLIKWKDRPFILTCGHVLRACGLPDNETAPWQIWIVFGGKTETNETMAGPLTVRRNNWWARGVDARADDTAGPDLALMAVPYQWAIDAEESEKVNVQFHDVEQVGTMNPPEYARCEDDVTKGVVLHLCGGWHGRPANGSRRRIQGRRSHSDGFLDEPGVAKRVGAKRVVLRELPDHRARHHTEADSRKGQPRGLPQRHEDPDRRRLGWVLRYGRVENRMRPTRGCTRSERNDVGCRVRRNRR